MGVLIAWLMFIVIVAAWDQGLLAVLSACFGIGVAFLGMHGIAVLWSIRKEGRARLRKVLFWIVVLALVFSLGVLPSVYSGEAHLVLDGNFVINSPAGAVIALLALWIIFSILGVLMLAAACSAIWFLEKLLRLIVPQYLTDVRNVRYERSDPWYARLEVWIVAFPRVLRPSSLRLEPQPMDNDAVKGRFIQALLWQLALGLLIAVYISLNPVLLQTMSFSQTFSLVSLTSIAVPLLILPWSTLEALGARVDGVREDFYLHIGARTRMIQTMVALGTLFLIVRMAIQEIGVDVILWRFAGYTLILFMISALVSFVYFNYFEESLIQELRERLKEKGFN